MRRLRPAFFALPCALLLLSLPLAAQQVYKWKDANGVTQYGATPPPKGSYEARAVDDRPAAEPQAKAGVAEDPACTIARDNVVLLKGKAPVGADSDGDGKPDKPFSDEERADQLAMAEATAKVKCAPAAATQAEPAEE